MVVRHTIFNLLGLGLPLLVAVVTIPILIDALGLASFGVLTLIWAAVSYFGLFDLGLGRTLTMQFSVAVSHGEHDRVGPMVTTALSIMALLGIVLGTLLIALAGNAVQTFTRLPNPQQTASAVIAMGVALPAITLTSGLRGILEAQRLFGLVNLIRFPMGAFTFAGPVLVVWFAEPRLDWIAWALVAARWVALLVHMFFVWRNLPDQHGRLHLSAKETIPLLTFGGWLTVSNIVNPLMGYADRFIIAVLVSTAAAAYYVTPYEIATKLWIIPGALTAVLFPTFAIQLARSDDAGAILFRQSGSALALLLLPVCAFMAVFAHELITLWIDETFAENSSQLLQIFALGILINSTAHIPFTLIQSSGRPKWTALIHLSEVLPFLGLLWWATASFGVIGAAVAWLLRIIIDTVAMFVASRHILKLSWASVVPSQLPRLLALMALSAALCFVESAVVRAIGCAVVVAVCLGTVARDPTMQLWLVRMWERLSFSRT